MILAQPDGPSIRIAILGYQFPEGGLGWHDWNWLNVQVQVRSGAAAWTGGPDPCLLTTEARELGVWLRAVAERSEPRASLEFLEPQLSFAMVGRPSDGVVALGVTLRWALIRDQNLVADRKVEELPLVLHVGEDALRMAAADLEVELLPWPVRQDA
jgi:hypothetical protein